MKMANLPLVVPDQAAARQWLDSHGFGGTYDFFYFLPGKLSRGQVVLASDPQALGYFFVNFESAPVAQRCAHAFDGRAFGGSVLKVIVARKQGRQALLEHFAGAQAPWAPADCE